MDATQPHNVTCKKTKLTYSICSYAEYDNGNFM